MPNTHTHCQTPTPTSKQPLTTKTPPTTKKKEAREAKRFRSKKLAVKHRDYLVFGALGVVVVATDLSKQTKTKSTQNLLSIPLRKITLSFTLSWWVHQDQNQSFIYIIHLYHLGLRIMSEASYCLRGGRGGERTVWKWKRVRTEREERQKIK